MEIGRLIEVISLVAKGLAWRTLAPEQVRNLPSERKTGTPLHDLKVRRCPA